MPCPQSSSRYRCGPTGTDRERLASEYQRTHGFAGVPPGSIVRPTGRPVSCPPCFIRARQAADTYIVPVLIANERRHRRPPALRQLFAANVNHPHTRRAYVGACSGFFTWCEQRGLTLTGIPGGSRLCPDWQPYVSGTGITAYLGNGGALLHAAIDCCARKPAPNKTLRPNAGKTHAG